MWSEITQRTPKRSNKAHNHTRSNTVFWMPYVWCGSIICQPLMCQIANPRTCDDVLAGVDRLASTLSPSTFVTTMKTILSYASDYRRPMLLSIMEEEGWSHHVIRFAGQCGVRNGPHCPALMAACCRLRPKDHSDRLFAFVEAAQQVSIRLCLCLRFSWSRRCHHLRLRILPMRDFSFL
jgi:hypothetical protein